MFLSLGLSISTHEGHFYWYTGSKAGPAFSQVNWLFLLFSVHILATMMMNNFKLKSKEKGRMYA